MAHIAPLPKPTPMPVRDFSHLNGLHGFSADMMRVHLDLYAGYVDAANALMETLASDRVPASAAKELQARLGWEYSQVRLHELYFRSMSTSPGAGPDGHLSTVVDRSFGDVDTWWEAFCAMALGRRNGWAILGYDPATDGVLNVWVDERDIGGLAGTTPLVVVDLFEHARVRDFHSDRAAYLESFRAVLDWDEVSARLEAVRHLERPAAARPLARARPTVAHGRVPLHPGTSTSMPA